MAVGVTSGNTAITGTVSANVTQALPAIGTGQTFVRAGNTLQNDGTTIYTVTAGKTFYCLGVWLYGQSANTNISLQVAGTTVLRAAGLAATMPMVSASGGIVFVGTGNQAITVTGGGAGGNNVYFWGYEA